MNRNDDFTYSLEAWLRREAPSQAPDRVLEAALQRVATEPQRRGWLQRFVGETPMAAATRVAALAAVIGLAAAVGLQLANLLPDIGPQPSPSEVSTPSPSASASLPAGCVSSPDVQTLSDLIGLGGDPVACYGDAPLTFDGEIIAGVADCPGAVEPLWLSCPQTFLHLVGETRKVGAPGLTVAVDPASGVSLGEPNTNVRVTGHFDDPAAQTCGEIEPCRRVFVITEAAPLSPAGATGTITLTGGTAAGPGLSVSEAIASASTEPLLVNGSLLIDGYGTIWLCEALVGSRPPLFGGARLSVENSSYAPSAEFQEADGVYWLADSIQLLGNVSIP
jgi:hypothetical protein